MLLREFCERLLSPDSGGNTLCELSMHDRVAAYDSIIHGQFTRHAAAVNELCPDEGRKIFTKCEMEVRRMLHRRNSL